MEELLKGINLNETVEKILKPCPFCGGYPVVKGEDDCYWIECLSCHAEIAKNYKAIDYVLMVKDWNRRTNDTL